MTTSHATTTIAQRQDSTSDQMFDVMTKANEAGLRNGAVYLQVNFFGAKLPLAIAQPKGERLMDEVRRELAAISQIAVDNGCYDADQWLRDRLGL
jgi:hypothetical protein